MLPFFDLKRLIANWHVYEGHSHRNYQSSLNVVLHRWTRGNRTEQACKACYPVHMYSPNFGRGVIFMYMASVEQIGLKIHQNVHCYYWLLALAIVLC